MILLVVFGIFALHTAQIWVYALAFRVLGEFQTFEQALYFSTVKFSTVATVTSRFPCPSACSARSKGPTD